MRTSIIRAFTFLGGIYFFLAFILPPEIGGVKIEQYHGSISDGFTVVVAMAVGLGLINLLSLHGSRIAYLRKGWINSAALLIGLFAMLSITTYDWMISKRLSEDVNRFFNMRDFAGVIAKDNAEAVAGVPAPQTRNRKLSEALEAILAEAGSRAARERESAASLPEVSAKLVASSVDDLSAAASDCAARNAEMKADLDAGRDGLAFNAAVGACVNQMGLHWQALNELARKRSLGRRLYELLYNGLFVALGSAMFSLLGFYIAAAAYRAFRVRSAESGLMMAAAILVMLGQIPFGLWIWEGFPEVRLWLLSTPSSAAFRAIKIGAEIAGLVIAFRMWFSIESRSFSETRG